MAINSSYPSFYIIKTPFYPRNSYTQQMIIALYKHLVYSLLIRILKKMGKLGVFVIFGLLSLSVVNAQGFGGLGGMGGMGGGMISNIIGGIMSQFMGGGGSGGNQGSGNSPLMQQISSQGPTGSSNLAQMLMMQGKSASYIRLWKKIIALLTYFPKI